MAIFVDACIVINAYTLASLVLFSRWAPLQYYNELLLFLPVAVFVHCGVNLKMGLYSNVGRYAGLRQAIKTIKAIGISIAFLLAAGFIVMSSSHLHALVMIPIGGIIAFIFMSVVRFYPRFFYERSLRELTPKQHILLVGAGAAGEMIISSIQKDRQLSMAVIALIDDNQELQGMEIHGVPIFSPAERISEIVMQKEVDEIVIAIPSATLDQFQRLWKICTRTGLPTKTLHPLQSLHGGKVGVNQIREIEIEDLLGRQPVQTDYAQIGSFVNGKVVLVTGAGGSIGSELVMQISHHKPASIILVDRDESALYELHVNLKKHLLLEHHVQVVDIRSFDRMKSLFKQYKPELVFHAAAYKHVPLMELQPDEAVLNNVQGTLNLAQMSGENGVTCFVNISTDKAVEPANIMGASKHLSERLVAELGEIFPGTRYCSVRFGNVLDSRGSVLPIFRRQIRDGGPVTITHPEMSRYFMLISEAVDLVLQASAFTDGNTVYVLEMGKPVRIVDLAAQMIDLLKQSEKIDIVFTGLRPGEKLHEQLIDRSEIRENTDHAMIYRIIYPAFENGPILPELAGVFMNAEQQDYDGIIRWLQKWVPSYTHFDMSQVGNINGIRGKDAEIYDNPLRVSTPPGADSLSYKKRTQNTQDCDQKNV